MISFSNDYSEGACPEILAALTKENLIQNPGYGTDGHCAAAAEKIRAVCGCPSADVHFLVGGTPVNLISLAAFLRPHQAAIAATTGHIAVHEAGSIEATGHKVCTIDTPDGKLTPALVRAVVAEHPDEHMVQPRLVFIADSTEIGTLYQKAELQALRAVCDELGLLLYVDGARLASALTSTHSDLTLADLARYADAFYIGGTKNGALMGEALVICNDTLKADYRYIMKQRGGMLAKGWLLGLQFETLFTNDLYFSLAQNANAMATRLAQGFADAGFGFFMPPVSNQIFPLLPLSLIKELSETFEFQLWGAPRGDLQATRFVCSWATPPQYVEALVAAVAAWGHKAD